MNKRRQRWLAARLGMTAFVASAMLVLSACGAAATAPTPPTAVATLVANIQATAQPLANRVAGGLSNLPASDVGRLIGTTMGASMEITTTPPDTPNDQVTEAKLNGTDRSGVWGKLDQQARRAFAAKCVGYLTRGIGLIIVDIVTNRLTNLHDEVMTLLGQGAPFLMTTSAATYAVAYRPSRQTTGDQIEVWPSVLTLNQALPVLPLALRNAGVVPVDLEETYMEARQRTRLG